MKARSLLAVVLAALLVPAAALAAPRSSAPARSAPAASGGGMEGLSVGGFIGYETDDLSGVSLRADAEMPFRALSPQINLSWVGSVGFSYLTWDTFGADLSAMVLKVIPAARFSFAVNPQVTLFGDAGLGLYYASVNLDVPDSPFKDAFEDELGGLGLMMRIGAGAFYELNPKTRLGAMLEFDPYFGDFDQSTFNIMAGAMFRL
jgi:hypothetical protein